MDRVVAGEGEMPFVAAPGAVTGYADIAGPNGAFGTLDYGDGQSVPPKLYLGRQIDPKVMQLDSGAPVQPFGSSMRSRVPGRTKRTTRARRSSLRSYGRSGDAAPGRIDRSTVSSVAEGGSRPRRPDVGEAPEPCGRGPSC